MPEDFEDIQTQLNKFKQIKELEEKRQLMRINHICINCGTPMIPEGGCWLCHNCGDSIC